MQRTYYIRYPYGGETRYEKVVHRSPENRPNFHKIEALNRWKFFHAGYGYLNIRAVLTPKEYRDEVSKADCG